VSARVSIRFPKEDVESVAEIAVTIAPDFRLSLSRGAAENRNLGCGEHLQKVEITEIYDI